MCVSVNNGGPCVSKCFYDPVYSHQLRLACLACKVVHFPATPTPQCNPACSQEEEADEAADDQESSYEDEDDDEYESYEEE